MIEQIIENFDEIQPENKELIKKSELQIWGTKPNTDGAIVRSTIINGVYPV